MELPYRVKERPDTGLWSAKIGMWLFLASEIMLFGGFFSAYLFLRLGADYDWPHDVQNWRLGAFNTAVLIVSSVTIVFAWVSLKLKNYGRFVLMMLITIFCAFLFLALKFKLEYAKKLTHNALVFEDRSILAGHIVHGKDEGKHYYQINELSVDVSKVSEEDLKALKKAIVADPIAKLDVHHGDNHANNHPNKNAKKEAKKHAKSTSHKKPKSHKLVYQSYNFSRLIGEKIGGSTKSDSFYAEIAPNRISASALQAYQKVVKLDTLQAKPETKEINLAKLDLTELKKILRELKSDAKKLATLNAVAQEAITGKKPEKSKPKLDDIIKFSANAPIYISSGKVNEEAQLQIGAITLQTDEIIPIIVDEIDLSRVSVRENDGSIAPHLTYQAKINSTATHLLPDEKLRANYVKSVGEAYQTWRDDRTKPLYFGKVNRKVFAHDQHKLVLVPSSKVWHNTTFSPAYNTYYAIYYTITGLHALHVLGGALAFIFFLIVGKKWHKENPDLFANRIEVTGLFWHFVDLVWIFAFPIFYLF